MLEGTKKFLPGNEYELFLEVALEAAENDALPIGFQVVDTTKFTLKDIYDFIYEFNRDSGLEMTARHFVCNECGQLHTFIEVDYSDKEENTLLQ